MDSLPQPSLLANQPMKCCRRCLISQPLSAFHRRNKYSDDLNIYCKACISKERAAEYALDKEKFKQRVASYFQTNHEVILSKSKKRRETNIELYRARDLRRYHTNPDRSKENHKVWVENNRDKVNTYARQKQKEHPERIAVRRHRRRARESGAIGTFTASDILHLEVVQNGLCAYCNQPYGRFHVDHMQPLSRGGTNWPDNLCLACSRCNLRKNSKTEAEFRTLAQTQPLARLHSATSDSIEK